MRSFILLFLALWVGHPVSAQSTIATVSPAELFERIQQSNRPAVVQFWIPNCSVAVETVQEYDRRQKAWSSKIDFYFVGITNKPELIQKAVATAGFLGDIYMADTVASGVIEGRMKRFSTAFSGLTGKGNKDWITVYCSPAKKQYFSTKSIKISERRLKAL